MSGIDRAQVPLVEPALGLFREDAGEAFAVEIDPLVPSVIETIGQVPQALGVDFLDGLLCKLLRRGYTAVFEFERR